MPHEVALYLVTYEKVVDIFEKRKQETDKNLVVKLEGVVWKKVKRGVKQITIRSLLALHSRSTIITPHIYINIYLQYIVI